MASVVTLIIEKTMKKIFKKKIISDLPTLIFSRYETGTTGIFFTPWRSEMFSREISCACDNSFRAKYFEFRHEKALQRWENYRKPLSQTFACKWVNCSIAINTGCGMSFDRTNI
jgi:hypothetical protein